MKRLKRLEMPPDPAATVRALRVCREAMLRVSNEVSINGAAYKSAATVITAIDAFVTLLTGDPYYFHANGAGATEGQIAAADAKMARERGDVPWKP